MPLQTPPINPALAGMAPPQGLASGAPPPSTEPNARDNTFRFVLNVLIHRWRLLGVGLLMGVMAAGAYAWYSQEDPIPSYGAYSELIVTRSHWERDLMPTSGSAPLQPLTPQALIERISPRRFAEEVSRALIQRDISEGGPLSGVASADEYDAKTNELLGQLVVQPVDNTQKLRIEAHGLATQSQANDVAEVAARVFVDLARQNRLEVELQTHEFYQAQLEELRQRLFDAESEEWEFKKQMGFRAFDQVNSDMSRMNDELARLLVTREETEAKLEELQAELKLTTADLPEALNQPTDEVVNSLFRELDELLQEQLNLSAVYQPGFPALVELDEEIAEKQRIILETIQELDSGITGGSDVWNRRQEIYRQEIDLRLQLAGLDIRVTSLQRMLEELIPQIPELANKNLEYERLAAEVERVRDQFNTVRTREFDIRTALNNERGQVERHDQVQPLPIAVPPSGPQVWASLLIGALVGFIGAFAIAMMAELNDTSIRTLEDVTQYIGLEVIGTIPRMRFGRPRGSRSRRATYVTTVDESQIDACIVTQHDPKSPISEAYRTLRTNFQFATIHQHPKTLMVTSAVPGEGKTTTAVNMAVTFADRGMRVLIVDTDLRRPNVHRVLRMERGPGLADVLREGVPVDEVIRPTRIHNLSMITSGRVPPNPSELISSERLVALLAEFRQRFDIVICDAPSVLVVTDPVLLSSHVDTCVIVVSANFARRETVQRARKLLTTANGHIAGVVLNGLETTRRHYYYYYYYYEDGSRAERKWYHFA